MGRPKIEDPEAHFWARVDRNGPAVTADLGPCWLWTGARDKKRGYGRAWYGGRLRYAHNVAWELDHGPICRPDEIDHLCRVKPCVKPEHLELVSHAVNMARCSKPVMARYGAPTRDELIEAGLSLAF